MESRAADVFSAHLQVGRWLKDPLLAIVVVLRNLPLVIVTLGFWDGTGLLAPAWVVVLRRADGTVVRKIPAGRAEGAGEEELAAVQADLQSLDVHAFLARHDPDQKQRTAPKAAVEARPTEDRAASQLQRPSAIWVWHCGGW